jgi:uncharacterized paraquat-inducible protein A
MVLVLVALTGNIAALFLPFVQLRLGLDNQPYALFGSVRMLMDQGLWILAILVVGFSVVFPFAKLLVLAAVCRRQRCGPWLESLLHLIGALGKWSMLDVYMVCLILALTSGQWLVASRPLEGISIFIAAIGLSLLAGEILHDAPAAPLASPRPSGALPLLLVVIGVVLVAAVVLPVLRVDEWALRHHDFSITTMALAMIDKGAWLPGATVLVTLVVVPALAWLTALRIWWVARQGRAAPYATAALLRLRRWSMLDVFLLALVVFLVEGREMVATEMRWGSIAMAGCLVVRLLAARQMDKLLGLR